MKRTIYGQVEYVVADINPEVNDGQPGKILQFRDTTTGEFIDFPMSNDNARDLASKLNGTGLTVVGNAGPGQTTAPAPVAAPDPPVVATPEQPPAPVEPQQPPAS